MPTSYGLDPRNVAVIGAQSGRLAAVTAAVTRTPARLQPVTTLIVAEAFDAASLRKHWRQHAEVLWMLFESALWRTASLSEAVLVAFSSSDDGRERRTVREAVERSLESLASHALTAYGVDFTVNAVEVPPSGDHVLLDQRLIEETRRRCSIAHGIVLPIEALRHRSFAAAVAATVL